MKNNSRRIFMKNLICGAISTPLAAKNILSLNKKQENRIQKGQMFYRRLGRTNLFISEISLGGSPIPDWALFVQIIERGVNYIDTSHTYSNGNSERQIGRLLKEVGREKIYVSTKFHLRGNWSENSIINSVNNSLRRLNTDYIDILCIHGASNEEYLTDEKLLSAFEKLKKQGKYKFRGLSCHSNHHEVVKKAVECEYYDVVLLGYNVFDIQDTQEDIEVYDDYLGASGIRGLISLAKSKDVGIIALKTLKVGGKRQNLEKYRTDNTSIFQAMLKWALENENISSVLTEMLTFKQMEEDLGIVGQSLSEQERKNLFRYVAENSKDYCHMCGQCERNCSSSIKTSSILRYLAYFESYRKVHMAREAYSRLEPAQTALSCQNCGQCEMVCPYGVSVRKRIKEAHMLLSKP